MGVAIAGPGWAWLLHRDRVWQEVDEGAAGSCQLSYRHPTTLLHKSRHSRQLLLRNVNELPPVVNDSSEVSRFLQSLHLSNGILEGMGGGGGDTHSPALVTGGAVCIYLSPQTKLCCQVLQEDNFVSL